MPTRLYLEYNPYTVSGKLTDCRGNIQGGRLSYINGKRLQHYLSAGIGWKGLLEEIGEYTNDDTELVFRGRRADFEDLEYALKKYGEKEQDYEITLRADIRKNDNDVMKLMDGIIPMFANAPDEGLRAKLLSGEISEKYEKAKNSEFQISVIATMSSGKSTLINSMLGKAMLPALNAATTATVARILDNGEMDGFTVLCRDKDGNVVKDIADATPALIKEYNKDPEVRYIDMEGPIPGIHSESMRLRLLDTPGPNSSVEKGHREITESIVNDLNKSVVLYVMNAAQFGIKDDSDLLEMISNAMSDGNKQSRDRFIFVVNKCDELDPEKDETVPEFKEMVREYLSGFGISEPNIFFTSAKAALLMRCRKTGEELTKQDERFLRGYMEDLACEESCFYDSFSDLTGRCRDAYAERVKNAEERGDADGLALLHTGVPAVETAINEYLLKYAYPMKVGEAIEDIVGVFDETIQDLNVDKKIAGGGEEVERLRAQVAEARESLRAVQEKAEIFHETVKDFGVPDTLRRNIISVITASINDAYRPFYKYDDKRISKTEAGVVVNKLCSAMNAMQENLGNRINAMVNDNIKVPGKKMLDSYREYMGELRENIRIDGFDFDNVRKFSGMNIDDVDSLIVSHTKVRMHRTEYSMPNPEREGFWGHLKFWKPKVVTGTRDIKEEYVDVGDIISEEMEAMRADFTRSANVIIEDAEKYVDSFKEYFYERIKELDGVVENKLVDIENKLAGQRDAETRLAKLREVSEWAENVSRKIKSITEFEA